MMKAVQIYGYSKKLEAHINDFPIPGINKHQVLIKTYVAGVKGTAQGKILMTIQEGETTT